MQRANNLPLAKKMGFKTVEDMLTAMGYSNRKLADLKGKTPEDKRAKQERKIKELVVCYYDIDVLELVEALELFKATDYDKSS